MQVKTARRLSVEIFIALGIIFSAQCANGKRLRLSAREQRTSVRARQDRLLDVDGADVFEAAAIQPFFFVQDHLAHERRLEVFVAERHFEFGMFRFRPFREHRLHHCFFDLG